ncbi:MAG: CHAT domain-containing tetratricopeptide repeat protein [Coleofasciculaceae cyanobacterium]
MLLKQTQLLAITLLMLPVTLVLGEVELSKNYRWVWQSSAVLAQTADEQKAEAERLMQQGFEYYRQAFEQNEQAKIEPNTFLVSSPKRGRLAFQQAVAHFQRSLTIYREISDRRGVQQALAYLGHLSLRTQGFGLEFEKLKGFEKAREYFQESLAIAQERNDRQAQQWLLQALGYVYGLGEEYDKAISFYQRSLSIAQVENDRQWEQWLLLALANPYFAKQNNQQAIKLIKKSLTIAQERKDFHSQYWILQTLGDIYGNFQNYSQAVEFYQQSLAITQEPQKRKDINQRSEPELNWQKLEYIFVSSPTSLNISKAFISPFDPEIQTLGNLTLNYQRLGEQNKSRQYQQQLQQLQEQRFKQTVIPESCFAQRAEPIEKYQHELELARELSDRRWEAMTLKSLGLFYTREKNYTQAIELYQQWLTIARETQARWEEVDALRDIAQTYLDSGNLAGAIAPYQQAIASYQQWRTIAQNTQNEELEKEALEALAFLHGNLGQIYSILGENDQAINYQQKSKLLEQEFAQKPPNTWKLEPITENKRLLQWYQQNLTIAQALNDIPGKQLILLAFGRTHQKLGNLPQALSAYQQSLAIAQEFGDHWGEAVAMAYLGSAQLEQQNFSQAIDYYQNSLAIVRNLQNQGVNQPRAESLEILILRQLGVTFLATGNFTEAEKLIRTLIELEDSFVKQNNCPGNNTANNIRGNRRRGSVQFFDLLTLPRLLQKILVAQNKTEMAIELTERERTRVFVELLVGQLFPSDTRQLNINLPTVERMQQVAKEQNSTLVTYSIIPELRDFDFQESPVTPHQNVINLRESTLTFGDQYYPDPNVNIINPPENSELFIWVIQPTGKVTVRQVDLKPLNTSLEELVTNTRHALGARGRSLEVSFEPGVVQNQSLEQLHQILIEPIADLLPTKPNEPVIFIPEGSLFLVPFPALTDKTGSYLIEKHAILTAPSIQVLELTPKLAQKQKQNRHRTNEVLVVGNPTMPKFSPTTQTFAANQPDASPKPDKLSQVLPPLPGAEQEAQTIAQLFNTLVLTGDQASKLTVVKKIENARIIHLATHGLLDSSVEGAIPGIIALAPDGTGFKNDGLLSAEDILELRLNAELVVLSACDTGRGNIAGDGVIGLSRSLMLAGVPSIIASLWSVPDAPTAELMTEFYQNLDQNPDKAQALRQAMLTTMEKHPNPRDWAAFTLIGEAE